MLIYKIIFSLLTFFPYLFIFLWAWPKGACRMQTDRSTDKQTDIRSLGPTPRIGKQTEVRTDRQTDRRSLSPTPKNWRTRIKRKRALLYMDVLMDVLMYLMFTISTFYSQYNVQNNIANSP